MPSDRAAGDYLAEPPLALAHRGGSLYPPNVGIENTMSAFRAALDLGFSHVETDVHATADGVLVAAHDEVMDRITDRTGRLDALTWDDVSAATVGGRERIPRLAEVLTELTAYVNIDLKARRTPELLMEVLDELGAHDRVVVGSFSNVRLWRFRSLARGAVATSAGPLGTASARLLPRWLTRWVHTPGVAFQVPMRQRLGPVTIDVVTAEFVRTAHAIGKQVHVWTIDDAATMHRLLDLGVDGIVTDRPEVLRDVFLARAIQWPPGRPARDW